MGRGKDGIVAGVLGAMVTLSGSVCRAEDAPKTSVRVLGEEPDMTFEVLPRGQTGPGQRCSSPCEVVAPPGRYQLRVYRGAVPLGGRRLRIDGPAEVRVSPPNVARQNTGLALGITGSALFVAGFGASIYALVANSECRLEDDPCRNEHNSTLVLGVATMLAGAVLAPIGWVMYGVNRSPRLTITPLATGPHGAGMHAALAF